jgi:RNA polymerase sigma-70 factor (ECF subfamily)
VASFSALLWPQVPRLRRYARALTGDPTRADDLVQDTLERALTRGHLWRRDSDLRAWLFTIMHNQFVNRVRASDALRDAADIADFVLADPGGPGDAAVLMDLEAALARLPDEQREVLLLIGLEELSYQEAATVLGVPIGTVMSRLSRGRERLRRLMADEQTTGRTLKVVK